MLPTSIVEPPKREVIVSGDSVDGELTTSALESMSSPSAAEDRVQPVGESSTKQEQDLVDPLEVRILGPVEVVGWRQEPERRVVVELACYLALHRDRPVSADELRVAIWQGDLESEASAKSLRNSVSLLRKAVGPQVFPGASKGSGYHLSGDVRSDWGRFEELAASASGANERATLKTALELVRGSPFEAVSAGTFTWAWTELLVSRIEVAVTGVALRLASLELAAADPGCARWATVQGLSVCQYDRSLWAMHLRASEALGHAAHHRAWRDAKAVLGSDAGELNGVFGRTSGSAS